MTRDQSAWGMFKRLLNRPQTAALALTLLGFIVGAGARIAGSSSVSDWAWGLTTVLVLVPSSYAILRDLLHKQPGVDVIAMLAMAGSLALEDYIVGAVIAVMFSGGHALEEYASTRAQRELRSLLERMPRVVHRYEGDSITAPQIGEVKPGDRLLINTGELVPVDGLLEAQSAVLDESTLTGEPGPVEHVPGDAIRSGATNAGAAFDMRATVTAEESTYAGIVRLVRAAQASKAPFVRLADRYALAFLPLTLVIAGLAWALSGDLTRALAVLVVATPCPLILAAPVAIVSGISRAAKRGIIVKDGSALEALGRARVLLLDKTGTLTAGSPAVLEILAPGEDNRELLRLAASLDQASQHVLAAAIVRAARAQGLALAFPSSAKEQLGRGIRGMVEGYRVAVGRADWVAKDQPMPGWIRSLRRRTAMEGLLNVFVAVDGRLAGAVILDDPIRADSPRTLRALRGAGIQRIVMVTGDRIEVAETVGATVGVDQVLAERAPAEKVDAVRLERAHGITIMVGDGVNDAPALAAADVGVAMGARGATASSEAADVVLVVDRLDRLAEALRIARRARGIALQSVTAGMGLSVIAMIAAALGAIPPIAGAILQEGIDVAVILNALRVLGGGQPVSRATGTDVAVAQRFREEHAALLPVVGQLRVVADQLDRLDARAALAELKKVHVVLADQLLPHERAEEAALYPVIAKLLGGDDPTGTMSRSHVEIAHQIRILGRLVEDLSPEGPDAADLPELRRILYGLHAILRLHFAQEEEDYLSLVEIGASPEVSLHARNVVRG